MTPDMMSMMHLDRKVRYRHGAAPPEVPVDAEYGKTFEYTAASLRGIYIIVGGNLEAVLCYVGPRVDREEMWLS